MTTKTLTWDDVTRLVYVCLKSSDILVDNETARLLAASMIEHGAVRFQIDNDDPAIAYTEYTLSTPNWSQFALSKMNVLKLPRDWRVGPVAL